MGLIIKAQRGDGIDNKYHGMGRTELAASGLTKGHRDTGL